MYIRLTTRCNMTCEHCCVSATKRGRDMSMDTFKAALRLAQEYDSYVTLGGGEPTLHPEFEHMLMLAIGNSMYPEYNVLVVTNGSQTERALLLARLNKKGVISAELSLDEYHDPIDFEVVKAFGKSVRNNSNRLINVGRAKNLFKEGYVPDFDTSDLCPCIGWSVQPNGDIRQCGCSDAPLVGNVNTGITTDHVYPSDCHKDIKSQIENELTPSESM